MTDIIPMTTEEWNRLKPLSDEAVKLREEIAAIEAQFMAALAVKWKEVHALFDRITVASEELVEANHRQDHSDLTDEEYSALPERKMVDVFVSFDDHIFTPEGKLNYMLDFLGASPNDVRVRFYNDRTPWNDPAPLRSGDWFYPEDESDE